MWWAGCEGRCAPRSAVAPDLTRMGNEEMKLTLAHEIRARAIACSPLGCIGHAFSDAVAAGSGVLRSIFPLRFQCCGVMSRVLDCLPAPTISARDLGSHMRQRSRSPRTGGQEATHGRSQLRERAVRSVRRHARHVAPRTLQSGCQRGHAHAALRLRGRLLAANPTFNSLCSRMNSLGRRCHIYDGSFFR